MSVRQAAGVSSGEKTGTAADGTAGERTGTAAGVTAVRKTGMAADAAAVRKTGMAADAAAVRTGTASVVSTGERSGRTTGLLNMRAVKAAEALPGERIMTAAAGRMPGRKSGLPAGRVTRTEAMSPKSAM